MSRIYLKELSVNGPTESKIEFKDGPNIIVGPSNTGKSLILRTINFVLGAKDIPDFYLGKKKYESAKLTISIDNEEYSIIRRFDNKSVSIVTTNSSLVVKDSKFKSMLLKLFGISDEHYVPNAKKGNYDTLTFRSLKKLWYIDENTIFTEHPVILDFENKKEFYTKAEICFLITGKDYETDKDNRELKKKQDEAKSIAKYLNKESESNDITIQKYKTSYEEFSETDVTTNLNNIIESIESLNVNIEENVNKVNTLHMSKVNLMSEISKNEFTITKYKELVSQYKSDIKRLKLMQTSKGTLSVKKSHKCPLCNSVVNSVPLEVDLDAVEAEINKISGFSTDLEELIKLKEINLKKSKVELEKLSNEIKDVSLNLETILYPQIRLLSNEKDKVYELLKMKSQYDFLKDRNKSIAQEIIDLNTIIKKPLFEFDLEDYYPTDFTSFISNEAKNILELFNFPNLLKVRFDLDKFDLSINDLDKASNNGQGYRSLINTAVILSIRKYIELYGAFKVPFLLIDKPFNEFDSGLNDSTQDDFIHRFFIYLADNVNYQTIFVENTNRLNNLDLLKSKCNIIEYSVNPENKKGFLNEDIY